MPPEEAAETGEHKCPSVLYTCRQTYLVVDCKVIFSFPPENAALVLLGSYYVFHIAYPQQFTGVFSLLERLHGLKPTQRGVAKTVTALEAAIAK